MAPSELDCGVGGSRIYHDYLVCEPAQALETARQRSLLIPRDQACRNPRLPLCKLQNASGRDRRRPGPWEVASDALRCPQAKPTRLIGMLHHAPHRVREALAVDLRPPSRFDGRQSADSSFGQTSLARLYQNGDRLVAEVQARSIRRNDHRQSARHRLRDWQPEALTAIRMHEALACGIQARHLLGPHLLIEIHDLWRGRIGLELSDPCPHSLTVIEGRGAEVFDHEADVVLGPESRDVRIKKNVDAFPGDSAAHEQEAVRLLGWQVDGRYARMESRRIDSVRHHRDLVRVHAATREAFFDIGARDPHLVDHSVQWLHPG